MQGQLRCKSPWTLPWVRDKEDAAGRCVHCEAGPQWNDPVPCCAVVNRRLASRLHLASSWNSCGSRHRKEALHLRGGRDLSSSNSCFMIRSCVPVLIAVYWLFLVLVAADSLRVCASSCGKWSFLFSTKGGAYLRAHHIAKRWCIGACLTRRLLSCCTHTSHQMMTVISNIARKTRNARTAWKT